MFSTYKFRKSTNKTRNSCKVAYIAVVSPHARKLLSRVQILVGASGLPHLSRWEKKTSLQFSFKKN
jgi:hypothetical protein